MIAPDSKTGKSPASRSTIAGMRPFGLMARNQGSFCTFLPRSTPTVLYGIASSSSVIEALWPFGVGAV